MDVRVQVEHEASGQRRTTSPCGSCCEGPSSACQIHWCQRNGGKIGYRQRFLTTTASGKHQCRRTGRGSLRALKRLTTKIEGTKSRKIVGLRTKSQDWQRETMLVRTADTKNLVFLELWTSARGVNHRSIRERRPLCPPHALPTAQTQRHRPPPNRVV
jgi:hypothetical protein